MSFPNLRGSYQAGERSDRPAKSAFERELPGESGMITFGDAIKRRDNVSVGALASLKKLWVGLGRGFGEVGDGDPALIASELPGERS